MTTMYINRSYIAASSADRSAVETILGGAGNLSVGLSNNGGVSTTHYGCSTVLTAAMRAELDASGIASLVMHHQDSDDLLETTFETFIAANGLTKKSSGDPI